MIFQRLPRLFGIYIHKKNNKSLLHQVREMSTSLFTRQQPKEIGSAYFFLLIPGATFCLGTWQIQRLKWKLNLLEELKEKTTASPVPLPLNLKDVSSMEYCRIKVKGVFLHDQEMYIRPRSLVPLSGKAEDGAGGGLISSQGQSGAYVVTPFKLSDRDETILVNRGWVPRDKMSPNKRLEGQIKGEVNLNGIVRQTENRPPLSPKMGPSEHPFWSFREIDNMAYAAGCAPVFLDACRSLDVNHNAPIAGQTRITLRNEHFSYIITWYCLTAGTAYLWYRRFGKGSTLKYLFKKKP